MLSKIKVACNWAFFSDNPEIYFIEEDNYKNNNESYKRAKELFGDLADFEGPTLGLIKNNMDKYSKVNNKEEEYITIFGDRRIGKKIGEGYWYLDSELNKEVATIRMIQNQEYKRDDFDPDKLQNFYKDSKGGYHIGFKNKSNPNLILLQETKEVYDLKECEVLTKL